MLEIYLFKVKDILAKQSINDSEGGEVIPGTNKML